MKLISSIRKDLKKKANKRNAEGMKKYFQGTIKTYGVSVPVARNIAKKHYPEIKILEFKHILRLCESLLKEGYMEEGIVAFEILEKSKKNLSANTLTVFEKWLDRYVTNWAHCDELSAHLIGYLIEPFKRKQNRQVITKSPKFYLFDTGVAGAITKRKIIEEMIQ